MMPHLFLLPVSAHLGLFVGRPLKDVRLEISLGGLKGSSLRLRLYRRLLHKSRLPPFHELAGDKNAIDIADPGGGGGASNTQQLALKRVHMRGGFSTRGR